MISWQQCGSGWNKMADYKLSDEKLVPLWQKWRQTRSPKDLSAFIDATTPVLNYAVAHYVPDAERNPILLAHARMLAVDAAKKYDPRRGSLVNYLLVNLQRLQRRGAEQRQIIRQPERQAMGVIQLTEAEKDLEARLGRPPSAAELADTTGLSLKKIEKLRKQKFAAIPEAATTAAGARQLGTETQYSDELLEYAYIDADPQDKIIMEHHFGLHGAPVVSNTEIAKKLKVSPAAITQRLDKIYKNLSQWHELL